MVSRLLKLAIAMLFYIVYKTKRVICIFFRKHLAPTLIILLYHSIRASDVERFEKQMDMLLNAGIPVSLDTNISMLSRKHNLAVTFDDAYQSVLQNALPILRRKKIPATIFIPTGCLGGRPMWISSANHCYATETVMTEAQLKTLSSDLITIGSHTVSHINLTNAGESIARKEIFQSKETLERVLNRKVTLFSAPYGALNKGFIFLFREAGFERLFLNIPTFPASRTDLYILGRTMVQPTDWPIEYFLKLSGSYQWLPLAIRIKRTLLSYLRISQ